MVEDRTQNATPPTPPALGRVGDFEIEEEIGRGGMGVVYRARQISLNREVALKVLPSLAGLDGDAVARFQQEAEAAGRLSHPGIVPVYSVGEESGAHYFVMELIDGCSLAHLLDDLLDREPASLRRSILVESGQCDEPVGAVDPGDLEGNAYARSCAAIAADMANALAAAHQNHVIHRDLKPSNILIHWTGRPMLADFGLARDDLQARLTVTGDTVGTPAYMAPEQVATPEDIDARIDVYALGATLYEMLTLRPPVDDSVPGDAFRRVLDVEPIPVRKLNPRVPVELEVIVHTCLAKDREERYPAIEAVEIDLRSFLLGRRILARPPSVAARLTRAWHRARRNTVGVAAVLFAVLAAVIAIGVVDLQRRSGDARIALDRARRALIEQADASAAIAGYGRAESLLGKRVVREARVAHLREALVALYPAHIEVLTAILGSLDAAARTELRAEIERIEGRGVVTVEVDSREPLAVPAVLDYRALRGADGNLDSTWQAWPAGDRFALGEYLVRLRLPGHHPHVQRVEVKRDQTVTIRAMPPPQAAVDEGFVPVVDPALGGQFAIARTEMSRADYLALLQAVTDPAVRRELEPLGWRDRVLVDPGLPVRGLSFDQARRVAALRGAHLPDRREFVLAGTAGLVALRYPWGDDYSAELMVADPLRCTAPTPVGGLVAGASPLGVLHLLGNVAEYVADGGGPALAGGHFQSLAPAAMNLLQPESLFAAVESPRQRSRFAGLRLARFVAPPDRPDLVAAAHEAWTGIAGRAARSMDYAWCVREDGHLDYEMSVQSFRDDGAPRLTVLELETPGFLQDEAARRVVDGHDRSHSADWQRRPGGEASEVRIRELAGALRGARVQRRIQCELTPTTGLVPSGPGYVLRIPLEVADGLPGRHEVTLPAGSRVDSVEPPPDFAYHRGGAPHLVWLMRGDGQGRRGDAAVTFRRDGMLTSAWPGRAEIEAFVRQLSVALDEARGLDSRLLHPEFRQSPPGLIGSPRSSIRQLEVLDAVAVGSVVTVELGAVWSMQMTDGVVELRGQQLQLQVHRSGRERRVLRLRVRSRSDRGELTVGDGGTSYRQPALGVVVRPPDGVVLERTRDQLTELQVHCSEPRSEQIEFQVLGIFAGDEDTAPLVRARLTLGAETLRHGQTTPTEHADLLVAGAAPFGDSSRSESWLFETERGWSREQWLFAECGRRSFLLKAVARGATRQEAVSRFREHAGWFAAVAASVVID